MIILYDKNEQAFTSLGIGVLDDAISCTVTEELNGAFELEMEYPITGVHYTDIQEERIIYAKASDLLGFQPFRIYKITRPIDGTVTICAEHISYDMGTVPVRKLNAENLADLAGPNGKIQNGKMIDSPFTFLVGADKVDGTEITFKTTIPNNMRALLMGSDDSILNIYKGEYIFDKFNVTLCDRRGKDRGFAIRYSKNMIDLEQETSSELMFNGICPFYSNTTTETKVGIGKKYKEIYLSKETVTPLKDEDGNDIYPSTWLTYKSSGLEAITNILSLTTTNIIATEGDFFNHLVRAKKCIPQGSTEEGSYFFDATYNIAYINPRADEGDWSWLYKDEDITEIWQPNNGDLFRIYTPGDKLYKVYIFEGDWAGHTGTYRQITSSDNIPEYPPTIPSVDNTQEEKSLVILYEGDIIYLNEVRAIPKEGETAYSATWLQAVSEELQVIASDNRWKVESDIVQTIGVPSKTIYKVPTIEVNTRAYPIEGAKEYTRGWLSLGVTSYINPNAEQYSENWLYTKDSDGNPAQIIPNDYTTYGVTIDENISYYKWIDSAYEQIELKNALPIPDEYLIDGHGYEVERTDHTIYKCRWSADDNKYNHMVDTRYTYTNYEWNGQTYITHPTINDKIHTVDLSDKFKETPKDTAKFQKDIYDETIKYITDNKLGILKNNIKVSFVKLSSSPEYSKWKELETVVLGDTVHVIYEDLCVNEEKKVIKTEYNSLTETYDSIEIGDKGSTFVNSAIVAGDSVSALTNDRNFADITTVTSLVAERIKAEYIQAVTAEITEAQIETLTTNELNATLITAQKFEIDNLVASLLTADDAAIRNTLVVGDNLIVNGEINILNGSISISGQERIDSCKTAYYNSQATQYDIDWLLSDPNDSSSVITPELGIWYKVIDQLNLPHYYTWQLPTNDEDGKYIEKTVSSDIYFEVDESGNVRANSLTITGGSIEIEGPEGSETSFSVSNNGLLEANGATIHGRIEATEGYIGDAYIVDGHLQVDNVDIKELSADRIKGGTLKSSEIRLDDAIEALSDEEVQQYSQNWLYQEVYNYEHAQYEKVTIIPEQNKYYYVDNIKYYIWNGTSYVESETEPTYFEVDNKGNVTANSLTITGGAISIAGDSSLFNVTQDGTLEANSVKLTGGEIENLDITGYLFFKSKDYITAYVMTSLGTTSYSDGYLAYTSDNSYMEYSGTYSYEDGVLTLTTNSQEAEYTRNYISSQGNTLSYSINYFGRLSEHNPTTDGKEGPALVPDINETYLIMDYRKGYEHTAEIYGLYTWNGSEYVISQTGLYYISNEGLYLPGIRSTVSDGTTIAGFNIDENTIYSSKSTSEVGICSDPLEDYAIWAGKANSLGEHPFSVTHEGYLSAKSGKIADLLIASDYLTSNSDKTSHSDVNEYGLFIDSNGITLSSTSQTKSTFIRIGGEYGPITGIITPQLYVNFKNYDPDEENVYTKYDPASRTFVNVVESIGTTPFIHMDPIIEGRVIDGFIPNFAGQSSGLDSPYVIEDFCYRKKYTFMFFMIISDGNQTITMPSGYKAGVVIYNQYPNQFTVSISEDGTEINTSGSGGGMYYRIGIIGYIE